MAAKRQIDCTPPIEETFHKLGYYPSESVLVRLSGLLVLTDLGKLVASKVDPKDVLGWLKQQVQDLGNAVLLNEAYVDLFDRYEGKVERMREALIDAAAGIGYDLRDARIRTNLEFEILRDGIVFIPRDDEGIPFSLAVRECKVVLGIEVRMSIQDRSVLSRLFESRQGVINRILKIITDAVGDKLHEVYPDEFYLNFYGSKDKASSVETGLIEAARLACIQKLGLGSSQHAIDGFDMTTKFTVKPDELWNLFTGLTQYPMRWEPLEERNSAISVDVHCIVRKVSPEYWLQFFNTKPTPKVIEEHVRHHIESYINDATKRYGVNTFFNTLDATIQEDVQNWVNFKLSRSHGVTVLFTHWVRHDAERGQPIEDLKRHLETLREARQEVLRLLGAALKDVSTPIDELEALKKRLSEINAEILSVEQTMGTRELIRPLHALGQIEGQAENRRLLRAPINRLDAPQDEDLVQ